MRIIIPMAGMGKRMRPHTLTLPKPLLKIAGKSIVERLVDELSRSVNEKIEEIAFIIGHFGKETENYLLSIAEKYKAKGSIYYQDEPLGTAHAVYCAAPSLQDKIIVAFADTLFNTDVKIDESESLIWVKKVDDPSQFGVVKVNENNIITDFIEKPKDKISDLAIIGIYYFKDAAILKNKIQYLIDHNICVKGEYQLTDALELLKNDNVPFKPAQVNEWLDCGNVKATLETNSRTLQLKHNKEKLLSSNTILKNSVIIDPCFIDDDVTITNSVVGPNVSLHKGCVVSNSVISNSIIYESSMLNNAVIDNSMIGNHVTVNSKPLVLDLGDYSNTIG